jgi:hypothetical protein
MGAKESREKSYLEREQRARSAMTTEMDRGRHSAAQMHEMSADKWGLKADHLHWKRYRKGECPEPFAPHPDYLHTAATDAEQWAQQAAAGRMATVQKGGNDLGALQDPRYNPNAQYAMGQSTQQTATRPQQGNEGLQAFHRAHASGVRRKQL